MKAEKREPCEGCEYYDKGCPYPCIFDEYRHAECYNDDCMFNPGQGITCEFSNKCGAYQGDDFKPELDYLGDDDEDDCEEELDDYWDI